MLTAPLGNGQGKDHQPHFSDKEAKIEGRKGLCEVTVHLVTGRHAAPALLAPPCPPRGVPCSWTMSWELSSGCSSSSSSEDQALSVASVMANCSATPVGTAGPAQRGHGKGGLGQGEVGECLDGLAPNSRGVGLGCPCRPWWSECPPNALATPGTFSLPGQCPCGDAVP